MSDFPTGDQTSGSGGAHRLGDRYELGDTIGRGGMAEVHEGRDLRLGRRVAVKILRPDLARDSSFHARFRREAQSAASLNHPNIVAVYDTGEDVLAGADPLQVPFIVMEFVDGITLRQLMSSGRRLLPERALEIMAGVLAALDYSHRHGIVHRDIKPANVMLTRGGDVKVMDFGIARALADHGQTMTAASAVMGTAQYLSPEQARGEVVDARSDLYSAGCLLYELLTGRPPFVGDSPVSVAYQHVSEQPVPPSQVDPAVSVAVDAVVLKALAKGREERYQTATDFRADVERAIAGAPVTAAVPLISGEPTTAMPVVAAVEERPVFQPERRSGWVWFALGLGVIAVAVGTLFLGRALFGGSSVDKVTVPTLNSMTAAQANAALTAQGLRLGVQTPAASDQPKDTIIDQQPLAGEQLEKGQAVNVTVSAGKEQVAVPQLVQLTSIDDARTALTKVNLTLGTVDPRDAPQPEGYVLEQSVPTGTLVDPGSAVNIVVSTGLVDVPSVVDSSEAQARADLTNANFQPQTIFQEDGGVAPGTVLSQSPQAGQKAKRGSTVTITVATAPPPPPPTSETPTPPPTTPAPPPTTPTTPPTDTAVPPATETPLPPPS